MDEQLQGTDQWRLDRLGKVTGSRMMDVMARRKDGKRSEVRHKYMVALVQERVYGVPVIIYKSKAMQFGTETEEMARLHYEITYGVEVEQTGFMGHPTIPMFGSSPDGLIGQEGGLEIKCPEPQTHVLTILDKQIDGDYILQCQTNMAVTGRKWWDFVSYDPRMPLLHRQMWRRRIQRDDEQIAEIIAETKRFLREADEMESYLRSSQE